MTRQDFTGASKRLIADRAGHQCSFPTCNRRTTGAGPTGSTVSGSGVAAHIYAASPGGPRGQARLTEDELSQPENGIWLCSDHAKLIDNVGGSAYSPETLLSYKALQEARVVREVQGLYSPIGWFHEFAVISSPVFQEKTTVMLAKLNLFFGNNGSGKTALIEWIRGTFDAEFLERWTHSSRKNLCSRLTYLNPESQVIETTLADSGQPVYRINGSQVPFVPPLVRVIHLQEYRRTDDMDDLQWLATSLRLPMHAVRALAQEVENFQHAHVRNLRWIDGDERTDLILDVDGTVPALSVQSLSGREKERVLVEFATAAARVSGRYCPTLLILDGVPLILFPGIFDFYSHHLLDAENQFQTIMCVPSPALDLDALFWKGWEIVRFENEGRRTKLSQTLRKPA